VKNKKTRKKNTSRRPFPAPSACELCAQTGGDILWRDKRCRVVLIADPDYAGYCRVIWNAHAKEMTDLVSANRQHCMRVVFAVEQALRNVLKPDKINLASFGNMTPHLHWHVIPRHLRDAHFPNPVWGKKRLAQASTVVEEPAFGWRERLAAELLNLL
jgi:diadenosine tetraphosphate (Ap4A) HIT family hydrolase